jgi:hypothetical protein
MNFPFRLWPLLDRRGNLLLPGKPCAFGKQMFWKRFDHRPIPIIVIHPPLASMPRELSSQMTESIFQHMWMPCWKTNVRSIFFWVIDCFLWLFGWCVHALELWQTQTLWSGLLAVTLVHSSSCLYTTVCSHVYPDQS